MKTRIILFFAIIATLTSCSSDDGDSSSNNPFATIDILSSDEINSDITQLYKSDGKLTKAVFNANATDGAYTKLEFTYTGNKVNTVKYMNTPGTEVYLFKFNYEGDIITGYTVDNGAIRPVSYDSGQMQYTTNVFAGITSQYKFSSSYDVTENVAERDTEPGIFYTVLTPREAAEKGVLASLDDTNVAQVIAFFFSNTYYPMFVSVRCATGITYKKTGFDDYEMVFSNQYDESGRISSVNFGEGSFATYTYQE